MEKKDPLIQDQIHCLGQKTEDQLQLKLIKLKYYIKDPGMKVLRVFFLPSLSLEVFE